MKGDVEVLVMIALFFVGALLGNTIALDRLPDWPISLADAIATLVATFLGAFFAFRFQERHEREERRLADLGVLNHTIFELVSLHNKFLSIQRQFLDPYANDPAAYLAIPPMTPILPPQTFNYGGLGFLLKSSNPNLLGTLSRVELEALTTLDVIRQRSNLHVEKVQDVVEKLELAKGPRISENDIITALGRRHTEIMRSLSTHMIEGVAAVLKSTREHVDLLFGIAKELFPGEKVIRMEVPKSVSYERDG